MTSILDISDLFIPAIGSEWNSRILANAATLELPTTAWQEGGIALTMIAVMSNMFGQEDGIISLMAQGGFLDFAATGKVTYTAANGQVVTQKVTPDPSVKGENPNGTPGWLDLLSSSVYNVNRIGAGFASNDIVIANTTSNTYGPFSVGTYHITNPDTGAGYSNAQILSISPASFVGSGVLSASDTNPIVVTTNSNHGLAGSESIKISGVLGNLSSNGFWRINVLSPVSFSLNGSSGSGSYTSGGSANICSGGVFSADLSGPAGTAAPGSITQPVTVLSGVSLTNLLSFVGTEWESNVNLASRCRLRLQALSPNGPKGAYAYFALSSESILAGYSPPVALSTPVTKALVQAGANNGVVTTIVASASGGVSGVSNLEIIGATNSAPIVVSTVSPHTLTSGDYVTISGVIGNSNANGTYNIVVAGASTFSLVGTTGNASYISGGVVEGGDLGQIDRVEQANSVPDGITAVTVSASNLDVSVAATVEVPQSKRQQYIATVQTALAAYFSILPIGGIQGEVQYNDIIGVLYASGAGYVQRITSATLNGSPSNLAYPSALHVARLSPSPAINVVGV